MGVLRFERLESLNNFLKSEEEEKERSDSQANYIAVNEMMRETKEIFFPDKIKEA